MSLTSTIINSKDKYSTLDSRIANTLQHMVNIWCNLREKITLDRGREMQRKHRTEVREEISVHGK